MRAKEFVSESRRIARPTKRQAESSVGMEKFRDPGGYDRTYELNRIMMAAACSDGTSPLNIDAESWSGRYNTVHPYSEVEAKMMKQAFKAVGSDNKDLNHGDLTSKELETVQKTSPVKGFKGFKK
jgi:hypothetical protein